MTPFIGDAKDPDSPHGNRTVGKDMGNHALPTTLDGDDG